MLCWTRANAIGAIAVRHDCLETGTVDGINGESDPCAHPGDSHAPRASGIPLTST